MQHTFVGNNKVKGKMYNIYNRIRAYLFGLLDAKFATETERMAYFCSFISNYDFDSLLDLGCGKGMLFDNIVDPAKSKLLVGVDLTKNSKKHHQHIVADATKLPFKILLFSWSLFLVSWSILPKMKGKRYTEMTRVIKKEGIFTVRLPNRYSIIESHTYLPFFGFLPSNIHSFAYTGEYVAVPSLKVVIESLKKYRFEICDIKKYMGSFIPFGSFLGKIGLFRLFPMGI